jgi:threonine dehydrogenase-like Zn-dependent dehydrogenase
MGLYQGGQAQYLRVPFADFNALKLPEGTENEADFILLADIFPTGWHGLVLSGFQSGESVAVFGAGPVGLMAAYSGILRGASKVFVVDTVPERLQAAEKIGCIPIDFKKSDPVEQIIEQNGGMVDRAVDAVGYQAVDASGSKEKPNIVLDQLIMVTRPTGGLGIPGLYVPADPGAPDEQSKKGQILISFGKLFEKVCPPLCVSNPPLTVVGVVAGYWAVQCQGVQQVSSRHDRSRQGKAKLCRIA